MKVLRDRKILYGITGSIAAYKSIDIIRRLKEEGAIVDVVMTKAALNFIPSLTIESACDTMVYTDLYAQPMCHVRVPEDAEVFVIAPATANIIGKFSAGIADDLLSTMLLTYTGKIIMAPAMNFRMYENSTVQRNIASLKAGGVTFVGPQVGALACGDVGKGRMADTQSLIDTLKTLLSKKDLMGHKVIITAGPTREPIDPVRFISNRSSGKMGYALARAARSRGAEVVLISGPVSIEPPYDVEVVNVETASEMHDQVLRYLEGVSIFIMVAAVADYTPIETHKVKLQKQDNLNLQLKSTKDIISTVATMPNRPFIVGFAAQTGADIKKARAKLKQKGADIIFFNDVSEPGAGFNSDTNRVTALHKDPEKDRKFPIMTKEDLSEHLLDYIIEHYEHCRV